MQFVEGEAIVTFKPSADLATALRALKGHSLQFSRHFAFLFEKRGRHSGLVHASDRTAAQLIAGACQLADPQVESAEPNYLRWISSFVPNDPLFGQLWGLQNTGQAVNGYSRHSPAELASWPPGALPGPPPTRSWWPSWTPAWTSPTRTSSSNLWTNPGEIPATALDDDGNGYVDDVHGYDFVDGTGAVTDSGYHGTHVAGTIAATGNNALGIIGVDFQAHIMALKPPATEARFTRRRLSRHRICRHDEDPRREHRGHQRLLRRRRLQQHRNRGHPGRRQCRHHLLRRRREQQPPTTTRPPFTPLPTACRT